MRATRQDCIDGLLEKNQAIIEFLSNQNGTELVTKLQKTIKKLTEKTDYSTGVSYQNEIDSLFAELLETATPNKGTKAHTILLDIANKEEKLGSLKRFFNTKAYDYNVQIETFPSSVIAQMGSKDPVVLFGLDDEEKEGIISDYRND